MGTVVMRHTTQKAFVAAIMNCRADQVRPLCALNRMSPSAFDATLRDASSNGHQLRRACLAIGFLGCLSKRGTKDGVSLLMKLLRSRVGLDKRTINSAINALVRIGESECGILADIAIMLCLSSGSDKLHLAAKRVKAEPARRIARWSNAAAESLVKASSSALSVSRRKRGVSDGASACITSLACLNGLAEIVEDLRRLRLRE